jgi:hypothetical protein
MPKGKRDPVSHRTPAQVKKQVDGYNARPDKVADRVKNNQARSMMMKDGRVSKGDGKDVHHKHPLRHGGSNDKTNLAIVGKSKNRGWRKND